MSGAAFAVATLRLVDFSEFCSSIHCLVCREEHNAVEADHNFLPMTIHHIFALQSTAVFTNKPVIEIYLIPISDDANSPKTFFAGKRCILFYTVLY